MNPDGDFMSNVDLVFNQDDQEVLIINDLGDDSLKCISLEILEEPEAAINNPELSDLVLHVCKERGR